ncbi:phospholipid scramblase 1-like isoform X2 [Convolutriloba macropyga]|uniref:phospholipid scramblase 1-like isoform X2 n=1 Tax=Convolutriloba macropyga TaxID=536237 RepID=UPI003F526A5F
MRFNAKDRGYERLTSDENGPPNNQGAMQPANQGPPGSRKTTGPGAVTNSCWMDKPQGIPGCPPGLEYLTQVDQILIHQVVELLEAFTGWETKNRYVLKNTLGQQVYYAMEDSDLCMRQCCGPTRGFIIHITDNLGQEVIKVQRDFKCCAGFSWLAGCSCCAYEVSIESPPGQLIGFVRQECSPWHPKFSIRDADGQKVLMVNGPCCVCQGAWCCEQEFLVRTPDGEVIGKIAKQFSGLIKEYFTDADNFGIQFPLDLDVKMKAIMIGAVFLIDFMFFENESNNRNS